MLLRQNAGRKRVRTVFGVTHGRVCAVRWGQAGVKHIVTMCVVICCIRSVLCDVAPSLSLTRASLDIELATHGAAGVIVIILVSAPLRRFMSL